MIPWNFFSCLRSEMQRICGAQLFRVMFNPAVEPTPALVLGIFFHSENQVTLQLNAAYRDHLQLALIEASNSPVCALCITDRVSERRQVVLLWKDEEGTLNASLTPQDQVRDIANYGRHTVSKILESGEAIKATQGVPVYLLILQGSSKDGRTHARRAYYTTSCMPSTELRWARQHFQLQCPDIDPETITEVFHTSLHVMHFGALKVPEAARKVFWVYVDNKPQRVAASVAVGLFREGKIKHVCRPNETQWRTLQEVGLVQV